MMDDYINGERVLRERIEQLTARLDRLERYIEHMDDKELYDSIKSERE